MKRLLISAFFLFTFLLPFAAAQSSTSSKAVPPVVICYDQTTSDLCGTSDVPFDLTRRLAQAEANINMTTLIMGKMTAILEQQNEEIISLRAQVKVLAAQDEQDDWDKTVERSRQQQQQQTPSVSGTSVTDSEDLFLPGTP